MENFKKLSMISQDQFDTLTPKLPVDPNQEVPPPPPCQGTSPFHLTDIDIIKSI